MLLITCGPSEACAMLKAVLLSQDKASRGPLSDSASDELFLSILYILPTVQLLG